MHFSFNFIVLSGHLALSLAASFGDSEYHSSQCAGMSLALLKLLIEFLLIRMRDDEM